jgi:transcriptional regulator with XRE-family HTH domain
MRLKDYLDTLSWSQTELAKQASISASTVRRAMRSETISRDKAKAICEALSRGLKRQIVLSDVNELHITSLQKEPAGRS